MDFEVKRFLRRLNMTLGLEVVTQHGTTTDLTRRFEVYQEDLAVPDVLSLRHGDIAHEQLEFGHFVARFSGWRFRYRMTVRSEQTT